MSLKRISESPLWQEQIKRRIALKEINIKVWLETNVFSPVWWLMLILFFALWFVWWKLVDKTRLLEIVAYGLLISLLSGFIDVYAAQNAIWGYPNRLTPLSPPLLLVDFCTMPVVFMLVYQYFTSLKSFSMAMLITAFLLAFVVEPISVWLDIFQLNNWKFIYSFLVEFLKGFSLKLLLNYVMAKQEKSRL